MKGLLLFILDYCVRFLYKKIEVRGQLAEGPVLLYANHSQGFLDAIVPLLVAKRYLRLIGAEVVFSK